MLAASVSFLFFSFSISFLFGVGLQCQCTDISDEDKPGMRFALYDNNVMIFYKCNEGDATLSFQLPVLIDQGKYCFCH